MNSLSYTSAAPNPWISYSSTDPHTPLKLFCFPYAGAGSSMYQAWAALLPKVELGLVHLPGRDKRIREPLQTRLLSLVEELTDALIPQLDRPFAFFGHSMGALIAFETARQLRKRQAPQPIHLFISARHPPQRPDPHRHLCELAGNDFLLATEKLYGALPDIVKQDPDVLHLFLTIMRADLTMLGNYQYIEEPALDCAVSVFGGVEDPSVAEEALRAWREQTTASFALQMFPGDHFFIQRSRAALLENIRNRITSIL